MTWRTLRKARRGHILFSFPLFYSICFFHSFFFDAYHRARSLRVCLIEPSSITITTLLASLNQQVHLHVFSTLAILFFSGSECYGVCLTIHFSARYLKQTKKRTSHILFFHIAVSHQNTFQIETFRKPWSGMVGRYD